MAYVALPEHAAERRVLDLVFVLGGFAHGKHAAHAHDHAPGLLRERGALGIEEAERLLRPERAEEGVEQGELVFAFLDPGRLDLLALVIADVGLTVRYPADLQTLGDPDLAILRAPLDILAQHPSEGHAGSRVLRLRESGGLEVAVSLGVELLVRVRHRPRERERRHERDALAHAGWQVGAVEIVEPLTRATHLHVIAPAFADARKNEAARVVERAGADASRPASVVPRDSDGNVVGRQAAGTGDHLLNSRLRTVAGPIGWDSGPQQGRGVLPG